MELTRPFASKMLNHGSYTFPQGCSKDHDLYPTETPEKVLAIKDSTDHWSLICSETAKAIDLTCHWPPWH